MEDRVTLESITNGLPTRFIGQRIIYHSSVTSTNDLAKHEAQRGAAEGTVVIADEQVAGKGRLKRVWLSPRGSIALSVILYPDIALLPSLIMVASLATAHSIEAVTGLKPQLKWPNDILISGRKVVGILIENSVRGKVVNYAVIGIGININLKTADYPGIPPSATSLSDELGRDVSRLDLVRSLLVEMEKLYLPLSAGESVYREWRDSLTTLGKKVHIKSGGVDYEGIAESVASDGSLMLRRPDGSLTKVVAGDITLSD
jgi:BirA family biotin operon repressor/biotin-[acetyl-CoA-carboxylase] ligase